MTFHCRCKFQTPSLSAFLAHWQEAHGVRVQDTSPRPSSVSRRPRGSAAARPGAITKAGSEMAPGCPF